MDKRIVGATALSAAVAVAFVVALVSDWNPLGGFRMQTGSESRIVTPSSVGTTAQTTAPATSTSVASKVSAGLAEEFERSGYKASSGEPEVFPYENRVSVQEVWSNADSGANRNYQLQLTDGEIRVVGEIGMWCAMPQVSGATLSLSDALSIYQQASDYIVNEGDSRKTTLVKGVTTTNAVVDFAGSQWTISCYSKPVIE